MTFLTALGVILLTMVGYAAGVTLAARQRAFLPSLLDLLLVLALWLVAFAARAQLAGRHGLSVLAALLLGLVAGWLLTRVRLAASPAVADMPVSELPAHAREAAETAATGSGWRRLWARWTLFGARLGAVQGRLLMGFFYFIFVTPFAVVYRLVADPLQLKRPPAAGRWTPKEGLDATTADARQQG